MGLKSLCVYMGPRCTLLPVCTHPEGSHPKCRRVQALQASSYADNEAALSPPMSVHLGVGCEMNKADNAGGHAAIRPRFCRRSCFPSHCCLAGEIESGWPRLTSIMGSPGGRKSYANRLDVQLPML
ncbi:hypothetical protein MTO96_000748 [Rhipicephalus appendiculatus]